MAVGENLFVATGGYYSVSSIADDNDVVLTNLGYATNASPESIISADSAVSPGGVQGPSDATGSAGDSSILNYDQTIATPGSDSDDPATVTLATIGPFTFTGECFAEQDHLLNPPVFAETFISTSQDDFALSSGGPLTYARAENVSSKPQADLRRLLGVEDHPFQESRSSR